MESAGTQAPINRKDEDLRREGKALGLNYAIAHLEREAEREIHSKKTKAALRDVAASLRARMDDLRAERQFDLSWWHRE